MLLVADVERRHTRFGKFKIIRAINVAFLRTRIGNGGASLYSCYSRQCIIQRGHAETGILDVACFPPDVHAVDVDSSQRFLEWVKRRQGIVFCTEQSRS